MIRAAEVASPARAGRPTLAQRPHPRRPGFGRIRSNVAWLVASLVVTMVALLAWTTLHERAERIEEAQAHAVAIARAIEPFMGRIIHRSGDYLVGRRVLIEGAGGLEAFSRERLEALFANRPQDDVVLRYAVASDSQGRVVAIAGSPANPIFTVSDRAFFREHAASAERGVRVSAPFRSRIDGWWRLPVSLRLDRPDGSFGGVINTAIGVEYFAGFFASLGLPEGAVVHLVTEQGESVARHPVLEIRDPAGLATAVRGMEGQEGRFRAVSPEDGVERLGGHRKLAGTPVRAIVGFETRAVLAPWRRNTAIRVAVAGAMLALTAFLTILLLRNLSAEKAAHANVARFRSAVDLSGDYIYWVEEGGRISYMNDSAARRFGVDPRKLPETHLRDLSLEWSEERWAKFSEGARRDGAGAYESVHRNLQGEAYPVQVSATYVELEDREFGFLVCRDLSEAKRHEAEIQELNATLEKRVRERTEQLAAANDQLESFASAVSHDLRAPLNHLGAYAQALEESLETDREEGRRLARRIVERSGYMKQLIDELLELSRVGRKELQRTEVDLSLLAREIVHEQRRLQPSREVEAVVTDGLRVSADAVLVRTLLENLVGNAWKYSSKVPRARIEVFAEEGDGERVFAVRDNGAGFDPRYAHRLFGAFQRLHSQDEFPGTGVGLATAKRVVARHGGRIWAVAAPGEGATFRFTLP